MYPYDEIIRLFRGEKNGNECGILTGTVKTTTPLVVATSGLPLDGDDLRLIHNGTNETKYDVDDKVLILTADNQIYYVIGKVSLPNV